MCFAVICLVAHQLFVHYKDLYLKVLVVLTLMIKKISIVFATLRFLMIFKILVRFSIFILSLIRIRSKTDWIRNPCFVGFYRNKMSQKYLLTLRSFIIDIMMGWFFACICSMVVTICFPFLSQSGWTPILMASRPQRRDPGSQLPLAHGANSCTSHRCYL